ncbi:6611_t:CDS:2 [Ambispora leptoticha]|uniref:6611_t:CDS:1 n=1 Tax=Ambispora leptoticha TaxID=144679 RepID=A0A9N9F236_9GLOM|nr:6611_t:CDS:2 [Ambispora leptoticha]
MSEQLLLCSLSQLIIDEIKFSDGTIQRDILGGGGAHAIYGMRIWFPSPESQCIAYLVHAGYDFPPLVIQKLLSLNISLTITFHSTLPSIRGLNTFTTPNHRVFTYQTRPIGTVPADLPTNYLNVRIFHFICTPVRAMQHVNAILQLRDKMLPRPVFVWEPVPDVTNKKCFEQCVEAMKMVDVVSPNHEEAAAFLGLISAEEGDDDGDNDMNKFLDEEILVNMADQFLRYQIGVNGMGCVIIRASYKGALVATKEKKELIPPYWTCTNTTTDNNIISEEKSRIKSNPRVVDVTGAGNSFCGGFAAGLLKSNYDVFEAALYGTVSASYTVEQLGLPRLTIDERTSNECWNGDSYLHHQQQHYQNDIISEDVYDGDENPNVRLSKLRQRVKDKLKERLKEKLRERIKGKLRRKENGMEFYDENSDEVFE